MNEPQRQKLSKPFMVHQRKEGSGEVEGRVIERAVVVRDGDSKV